MYSKHLLWGLCLFLAACSTTQKTTVSTHSNYEPKYNSEEQIKALKSPIQQYYALNQGVFLAKQLQADGSQKDFFVYNMVPLWENTSEYWVYVEGATVDLLSEPVEQYVAHIEMINRDTLTTQQFNINGKERFALGWYDPTKLKNLKKTDLVSRPSSCNETVLRVASGSFSINVAGFCPVEGGSEKLAYTQTDYTFDFKGFCVRTNFYDSQHKISREHPKQCALYARDLSGKFFQQAADEIGKKGKSK